MMFRKEIISITSLSLFTLLFKRYLLRSTTSVIFPDDLMAISILLLRKLKKMGIRHSAEDCKINLLRKPVCYVDF